MKRSTHTPFARPVVVIGSDPVVTMRILQAIRDRENAKPRLIDRLATFLKERGIA
jgi:hypothetical protein